MVGFGPTRARAWLPAALVVVALALAGCSPPESSPLTAKERDDMCRTLRDSVVVVAASAVYSPVFIYRKFDPAVPGGTVVPHPDCSYQVRSEFADRLEIFYFGPRDVLIAKLVDQLEDTGFEEVDERWVLPDETGQPQAIARIERFYSAPDALAEFRTYAELINRPAVVLSITSRRY